MNFSSALKKQFPPRLYSILKDISISACQLYLHPYLVGGVVRDLILKRELGKDIDVTISGGNIKPVAEELARSWGARLEMYPEFSTYTLKLNSGIQLDLITARNEVYPNPAALPVVTPSDLSQDLARRDFSINSMALSLSLTDWGELSDPWNGREDLAKKQIRILHAHSFTDDPTRIFRAARFLGRFGFSLESSTADALNRSLRLREVRLLSNDRLRHELEKILLEPGIEAPLALLAQWKVLPMIYKGLKFSRLSRKLLRQTQAQRQPLVLNLSFWQFAASPRWLEGFLNKLNFSAQVKDRVLEINKFWRHFLAGRPVESLPQSGLFPETVQFFEKLIKVAPQGGGGAGLARGWSNYFSWQKSRPLVDGDDLKKIGFVPGPIYKTIFKQLSLARYRKKVRTKKDELRFIIDNFQND